MPTEPAGPLSACPADPARYDLLRYRRPPRDAFLSLELLMRRNHLWLLGLCLVVGASRALPADGPAKESPTKGTTIAPEGPPLAAGGALSTRTPVVRPRSLKGA